MFETPKEVFIHIVGPLYFMFLSFLSLPPTIFHLLLTLQFSTLFSWKKLQDAWFARFWGLYGPETREQAGQKMGGLLAEVGGVVLEVGPGSGEWAGIYDKEKVTKIYGVEPNRGHHDKLRRRIKDAGLEDVYEIVPVGIEDLSEKWVEKEGVDCVVTIQCLCSVPHPKNMISDLYSYIKPGGKWFVYEHVVTRRGGLVALYQSTIDLIWPTFLGGCSITRDTEKWLREAGHWSKVDLKQPLLEPSYQVIPHVMGTLTK